MRRRTLRLPALALVLWLAPPAGASTPPGEPISLDDYVASLGALQRLLEDGRLAEARAGANDLRERPVAWGDEALAADANVLDAVLEARSPGDAARASRRLGRLAGALRRAPPGAGDVPPLPEGLERLSRVDPVERGGDVESLRVQPLTLPERIEAGLVAVADAIADAWRALRRWLDGLRPARVPRGSAPGSTAVVALAFALAVVVALTALVVRRRRLARAVSTGEPPAPLASRRDEDPLSRGAAEWEVRAAELAAARRWREAIRAWYHAVLVALFREGLLHHQRGRTNWEYVARLAPELAWRPAFMELTSLFDREWYGRRASDAEALASCARTARGLLLTLRGAGAPE